MIRWPLFCTRCGSRTHFAEDCKVPTLGLSTQESDVQAMARDDRKVVALAGVLVVLALALFDLLERVPS